jgi:GrpB-like predicted nucleotidyltransferase (UPF0157 family)
MERVNFLNDKILFENAAKTFLVYKRIIEKLLPEADVQHVGSTAICNSLTKGDLDIQVRVGPQHFSKAVQELSALYELNESSVKTDWFRAFKDDSTVPPLGVQLTVIGSEYDFFWKFRDVLLLNDTYRMEYDELKREFEGKEMDEYREAKNEFFQKLMNTPEFNNL